MNTRLSFWPLSAALIGLATGFAGCEPKPQGLSPGIDLVHDDTASDELEGGSPIGGLGASSSSPISEEETESPGESSSPPNAMGGMGGVAGNDASQLR